MEDIHTLRLILGDQLNRQHSWYEHPDPHVLYLIAELRQETDYVRHHTQKVCAFFAAMAEFAQELQQQGHKVIHLNLDKTAEYENLEDLIQQTCKKYQVERFEYQQPDEYRLAEQLQTMILPEGIEKTSVDTEHFLIPHNELSEFFKAKHSHRMETFYRKMRIRFGLLMDGQQPLGGRWNYDQENRKKLSAQDLEQLPQPLCFSNNVSGIIARLNRHDVQTFGVAPEEIIWPVNRSQAIELLNYFCEYLLPLFGKFQDAMSCQTEHTWSLYHSRISFALNAKILHPQEVIRQAIEAYEAEPSAIDLAQIEGFVRQVLGWREFVRGIYWANMPGYEQLNTLEAKQQLPEFFWTGQTRMKCMQAAIGQSLEFAYAHHIQRLMVTGNFCLLAGIDPEAVDAWYLGIYIDAIEWVEMPNTRGMSQYADGGIVASKPYAASGNYIKKMSDYCQNCVYYVKEKVGDTACPFNSLYWDFMIKHREKLANNPRIGMIYRNWDRQDSAQQDAVLQRAAWCKNHLEEL